jgi:CRP/FNR family transcriptional regulator, cyclic AMP receptor protein
MRPSVVKQTFKSGETIISQGDEGNTAFLIVSGTASVSIGKGSTERSVADLTTGDVFGEMSLIEPGPRSATVRAVTDVECIATAFEDFAAFIERNPEQAIQILKTLVRRLRHANEMMASFGPKKRSLRELIVDWQNSMEHTEADMSEVERRNYYEMMLGGMRGPYGNDPGFDNTSK